VFEKKVLKRLLGPRRDEVTRAGKNLHNEELHNLHSSSDIIRMIKLRRMRWTGNVACMGEGECIKDIDGKARKKETTMRTKT
jgi:hypothetical protein